MVIRYELVDGRIVYLLVNTIGAISQTTKGVTVVALKGKPDSFFEVTASVEVAAAAWLTALGKVALNALPPADPPGCTLTAGLEHTAQSAPAGQSLALWEACVTWVIANEVTCAEIIYQLDTNREALEALAERVCDAVGYFDVETKGLRRKDPTA